ncbi:MAG TPA: hypothetical protein VI365_30150, partial [Trebonia sp.]
AARPHHCAVTDSPLSSRRSPPPQVTRRRAAGVAGRGCPHWHAWRTKAELFDVVLCNCEKLAGAGVTHFTIPLNYLNLDLNELTDLLRALRAI